MKNIILTFTLLFTSLTVFSKTVDCSITINGEETNKSIDLSSVPYDGMGFKLFSLTDEIKPDGHNGYFYMLEINKNNSRKLLSLNVGKQEGDSYLSAIHTSAKKRVNLYHIENSVNISCKYKALY